jgi:hypothetical protein
MKFDIGKIIMAVAIIIVAVFLLMLGGCEKMSGPNLETECRFTTPISVMVYELDQSEMDSKWEYYNKIKLPPNVHPKGFSTYNLVTQQNALFVLKIRGQNDHDRIETIGHELMHSFCGDWHPKTVLTND